MFPNQTQNMFPIQNQNMNTNHQLIQREQTYVLDRKLLTVHDVDRDVTKWPKSNEFEITLPEAYKNVQSLRLVEIMLPINYYNISEELQNNKFYVKIEKSAPHLICIPDGFYTPEDLASVLTNLLNVATVNQCAWPHTTTLSATPYCWNVLYNEVDQKIYFSLFNNSTVPSPKKFTLLFSMDSSMNDLSYNSICDEKKNGDIPRPSNILNRPTQWGFGAYLGYNKENYTSSIDISYASPSPAHIEPAGCNCKCPNYDNSRCIIPNYLVDDNNYFIEKLITGSSDCIKPVKGTALILTSPNTVCMFRAHTYYMEIDKFNTMDELDQFVPPACCLDCSGNCHVNKCWNSCKNSDNQEIFKYNWKKIPKNIKTSTSGRVNSAFAKIPVVTTPHSQVILSRNDYLQNVSHYDPPVERIEKLKFKFRTHDGKLVDFGCMPLNFTLEFNCLKDEIPKKYDVRVPFSYKL